MTTIDLGVLPPSGADDEPPGSGVALPDSVGGGPGRPLGWVAGALGALVLLTATASAAPHQPWAVPLFTVPLIGEVERPTFTLTEDTLYVEGWTADDRATLTAYQLSDGTLRWEQAADHAYAWAGKPTLWNMTGPDAGTTVLLDPDTGQARWQGIGDLAAVVDDRLLITVAEPDPQAGPDADAPWLTTVTALDRQTAREVWSLPAVSGWNHVRAGPDRPSRLVTVTDSRLSTYDLTTGTPVATVEMQDAGSGWYPMVVGDVVVLLRHAEPVAELRGFELPTLRPLWTRELRLDWWSEVRCGDLLCVGGGRWLTALDPATGEQVWSGPRLSESGGYDLAWLAGYVLVSKPSDVYPYEQFQVLDAGTGEVVMDLGAWQPFGQPGGIVSRYEPSREMTVERLGPNQQQLRFREIGRTWFARAHPDEGRLEVLGAVDSGPTGCQAIAGYVGCLHEGSVQIWRVR